MREDLLIRRLREAIRKPAQELHEDMVRRGVIDEQGRVLLRCPEPPKKRKAKSKTRERTTEEDSKD